MNIPQSGLTHSPASDPLLGSADHWRPDNPLFESLGEALRWRVNRAKVQTQFAPDSVAFTDVERTTAQVFLGAEPHTDPHFDRWFVMLVLQAQPDAILHTAPHTKVPKDRPLKSAQDVPMVKGEIFVFDAHRIHWVESPIDVGLPSSSWDDESYELWDKHFDDTTVIIGTELRSRPSREVAEKRLLEFFSQYTPESWSRAMKMDPSARPESRAPRMKVKL